MAPPYIPFYPKDFVADSKVITMTTEEVGAYILLLCHAWQNDPPCCIPTDDPTLARITRLGAERWAECKSAVLACFDSHTTCEWRSQKRLRLEFNKVTKALKAKVAGGKKGAEIVRKKKDTHQDTHMDTSRTPDGSAGGPDYGSSSFDLSKEGKEIKSLERENARSAARDAARKNGESAHSIHIPPQKKIFDLNESNLPCDNMELAAAARRVVAFYQAEVKPAWTQGGGVQAVIGAMKAGHDENALTAAAKRYAQQCPEDPEKREKVTTFYGNGGFEGYLQDAPAQAKETEAEKLRRLMACQPKSTKPG